MLKRWTPILCITWLPLLYCTWYIFKPTFLFPPFFFFDSSYKPNIASDLSWGTIRGIFALLYPDSTSSLLLWLWVVSLIVLLVVYSAQSCSSTEPCWMEKNRRWIIALASSFRNAQAARVMTPSFVSDLFEWLHYISQCPFDAGSWYSTDKSVVFASPRKVGSAYQAFHHKCILTNGNTSGTLLYLISPWWQTVNH